MLWFSSPELDLCLGLIMIIVFGLYSLRNKHVYLNDIYFFSRCWPLLLITSYYIDGVDLNLFTSFNGFGGSLGDPNPVDANFYYAALTNGSLDVLLCLLTFFILQSFKSFESVLLIMLAFIGQLGLMHSCDLVSFYVCLEMQNFCFLVLCGLQPEATMGKKGNSGFSVEASIKFMLLSAFSSGIILFFFSALYLRTGMSHLFFKSASLEFNSQLESFMILLAMMFKLGAAPLHLWVVDIYSSVKRPLLMYINTAPKLSLFAFWVNAWHSVWTDFTVGLFVVFSMLLGSFGAYGQPALRALFAYSTINEIGLMLMAIETAGFHSLFQHLFIYIVSQLLLWNLSDKRLFSLIAVSLAGLPPLAGFFGKAYIFWHVANMHAIFLLSVSLFTTGLSLVYYLRVVRLFWSKPTNQTTVQISPMYVRSVGISNVSLTLDQSLGMTRVELTSACVIFLIFAPFFFIKPFVL
jgi:NADH:ubiquinone oxidoreductase subunit 2 (subunit N)